MHCGSGRVFCRYCIAFLWRCNFFLVCFGKYCLIFAILFFQITWLMQVFNHILKRRHANLRQCYAFEQGNVQKKKFLAWALSGPHWGSLHNPIVTFGSLNQRCGNCGCIHLRMLICSYFNICRCLTEFKLQMWITQMCRPPFLLYWTNWSDWNICMLSSDNSQHCFLNDTVI